MKTAEELMNERYFKFLCTLVGKTKHYIMLLHLLHSMEFYSIVPNDDNRAVDGVYVRDLFCDDEAPQGLFVCPSGPCTVLEMLIGLSKRLEFETSQSMYEKRPDQWFWILLDNLGLMLYDDQAFFNGASLDEAREKIVAFLERRYTFSGEGGLFPLRSAKKDQKEVEIWYQMTSYMMENYPI